MRDRDVRTGHLAVDRFVARRFVARRRGPGSAADEEDGEEPRVVKDEPEQRLHLRTVLRLWVTGTITYGEGGELRIVVVSHALLHVMP